MKFFVALTATLFSLSQTAASPISAPNALEMRANDTCDPGAAVPFFRAYSEPLLNHFYTTSAVEMENALANANAGYISEGNTGLVFPSQVELTTPLYRLYSYPGVDHFYTTSVSELDEAEQVGYVYEEIAAYVYQSQVCGSVPLLRGYSASSVDHFYTTSAAELENAIANGGYVSDGITGYVLPG